MTEPAVLFRAVTLEALIDELLEFLSNTDMPDFEEFLFCMDFRLLDALSSDLPIYLELLGRNRSKVPESLFVSANDFKPEFEHYRTLGGDWMHVKLYGILENKMLVTLQCPLESSGVNPESVPIRLTKCDKKPAFSLTSSSASSNCRSDRTKARAHQDGGNL